MRNVLLGITIGTMHVRNYCSDISAFQGQHFTRVAIYLTEARFLEDLRLVVAVYHVQSDRT